MPERCPAIAPHTLPVLQAQVQRTRAENSIQQTANEIQQHTANSSVGQQSGERWVTGVGILGGGTRPHMRSPGVLPFRSCHPETLSSIEGQPQGQHGSASHCVHPSREGSHWARASEPVDRQARERGALLASNQPGDIGATTEGHPRYIVQGVPRGEDTTARSTGEDPAGTHIPPRSGDTGVALTRAVDPVEESTVQSLGVVTSEAEAVCSRPSSLPGLGEGVPDLEGQHPARHVRRIQEEVAFVHTHTTCLPPLAYVPETQSTNLDVAPLQLREGLSSAPSVIVGRAKPVGGVPEMQSTNLDGAQKIELTVPDGEHVMDATVQATSAMHRSSYDAVLCRSCTGQDAQGAPERANLNFNPPKLGSSANLGHAAIAASWRARDDQSWQLEERFALHASGTAAPASAVANIQKVIQEIGERQEEARRVLELCLGVRV